MGNPEKKDIQMFMTKKGFFLLLAGTIMMILGYILMCGPKVSDPEVFDTAMFSFRRMVIAPIFIIAGICIDIYAIMHKDKTEEK